MTYVSKTETFHCYITIKCQGTSSMSYPKKNFTIKLFQDADRTIKLKKDFMGWGPQNKFCLKANYIDCTHARNIICARLWSEACSTRENLNERLAAAPNNGAIDGFHIKVYANGVYQGLYTWNIPKDGWMFDMEDNGNEAVYCCEVQTAPGQFRQEVLANGNDWSLEFPDEDQVNASVLQGFNNLVRVVRDTSDEEFIAQLPTVLDIEAAIDYYLFCYYFAALDQLGKNMLMVTYDGGATWIPSAYDNDSTWGSFWDGTRLIEYNYACPENYECSSSLLWQRLEDLFGEELYNRYIYLTGAEGPWSLANIITKLEDFYNIPRYELYSEDKEIFPNIPSAVTMKEMRRYMASRKPYVDQCLREIGLFVELEAITLQRDEVDLGPGESVIIRINFAPGNIKNKTFTVVSDNDNISIENNGQFIIVEVSKNISDAQTGTITITSNQNPNISATMTVNAKTTAVQTHTAPIISFDAKDFNEGTWIDSISGIQMSFNDGVPTKVDNDVVFDGSQIFSFDIGTNASGNMAIELIFTLNSSENGYNVLTVSPNTNFSWYDSYCIWADNLNLLNTQYQAVYLQTALDFKDNKKYNHLLLVLPDALEESSRLYSNVNNAMKVCENILQGMSGPSWKIISNGEGNSHFRGSIRKINVYNYTPTEEQSREILGIPTYVTNGSATITASMLELGSLGNTVSNLGQPVDYDAEVRTIDYISVPDSTEYVSMNQYYDTDRIYFYDENKTCISEMELRGLNEKLSLPIGSKYMKFLLKTTTKPDVIVTFYK